jgi:serine/threonine protein kinase
MGTGREFLALLPHSRDLTDADALDEGTQLGRYEIRRLIGRGGMGCVYEALHRDLKKRVAIKTLMPSLSANQEARVRFIREGEAASRIRHPNVVDVTDVGVEGTTSYLVMEYLEGEDLATYIGRQGPLSPTQTADIMLPVSAAIETAHEQGVIHRDLKPANVFLAVSALGGVQPKVLDFGISKVMGDRGTMVLTGTGATFGTTFYLPPEQLQGARQADAKSDQYALGTILYECVTGQRAFENDNLYTVLKNIAEGRYEAPRARRPDLPAAMEALIIRSMTVDPIGRFGSVKQLGSALLEFASPQARVMWTPFFGDGPGFEDDGPGIGYGMAGGTMILPPSSQVVRRVKPTPQPLRRLSQSANSTLGNATGESLAPFAPIPNLRKSRAPLFVGIGVIAVAGVVVGVLQLGGGGASSAFRSDPPPIEKKIVAPLTFRVEVETDPREATIELDGHASGSGALDQKLPSDGTSHVIVVRAPGYRDATVRFTDRPPPHLLALDPLTPPKSDTKAETKSDTAKADSPKADSTRGGAGVADDTAYDRPGRPAGGGHSTRPASPDHHGTKKHRRSGGSAAPDDAPRSGHESSQTANGAPIID